MATDLDRSRLRADEEMYATVSCMLMNITVLDWKAYFVGAQRSCSLVMQMADDLHVMDAVWQGPIHVLNGAACPDPSDIPWTDPLKRQQPWNFAEACASLTQHPRRLGW